MNRRAMLVLTGGSLSAAIAGCTGLGGDGGNTDDSETDDTDTETDDQSTDGNTDDGSTEDTEPDTSNRAEVDVGEDPEEVYRRYYEAISNGEYGVVLGVSHVDGPTYADFQEMGESDFQEASKVQEFTVEETTLVEESEDVAVVEGQVQLVFQVSQEPDPKDISPQLELRREDGQWRVWDAPDREN